MGFVLLQGGAFFARMSRVKVLKLYARACTKAYDFETLTSNANEKGRRPFESAHSCELFY